MQTIYLILLSLHMLTHCPKGTTSLPWFGCFLCTAQKTSILFSEVLMETLHHRGHLIREANMWPLDMLDAALRNTQTKEELWEVIAALRQDIYHLHVRTRPLEPSASSVAGLHAPKSGWCTPSGLITGCF